jgi:hypothetical protein
MNPPGREDLLLRIAAIVAIVLVLVLAYATVNLWTGVNQVPEINKQAVSPDTTGPVTPAITVCPQKTPAGNLANAPEIAINPVPDHALGDLIDFTGTANLAAGEPLVLKIYSAEFVPCPKVPSGLDSVSPCGGGFTGNVTVTLGNCGINTWSWPVDTSQHGFQPGGQYLLWVNGRDGGVQDSAIFNITGSQGDYEKPFPHEKIPGATT